MRSSSSSVTVDRLIAHLRQVSPTIVYSGLTAGLGLVGGVVLARALGPTYRGEMAGVVAWIGMIAVLGDIGVGYAVSYLVAKSPERVHRLWSQAILIALTAGVALGLLGTLVLPSHLHLSGLSRASVLLGFFSIPAMLAANHQGYLLLGAGYLRDTNRVRLTAAATYAGGVMALAAAGLHTPSGFLIVFSLAQFLSCGAGALYCRRRLAVRFELGSDGLRDVLSYGAKSLAGALSAQANQRLDQLLMSIWLSPAVLGLYVVAVALGSVITPLYGALTLVASTAVLRAPTKQEGAKRATRHMMFAVLLSVPAICALVLLVPSLLSLLFGSSFAPAATMARILLAASLFQGVNQISGGVLRSLGQPGRHAFSELAGVAVTIVLLIELLPRLGAMGAAVTSLVAYAAVSGLQVFFVYQAACPTIASLERRRGGDTAMASRPMIISRR